MLPQTNPETPETGAEPATPVKPSTPTAAKGTNQTKTTAGKKRKKGSNVRSNKSITPILVDQSPKIPVLLVEDSQLAAKKAIEGLNSVRYSYQDTTYQADLQGYHYNDSTRKLNGLTPNNRSITNDTDFVKYMMEPTTPFPAIIVFDNTLADSTFLGFNLAYICNLPVEKLLELANKERKEDADLMDEVCAVMTNEQIQYLKSKSINYKDFLQVLATKKSQSPFPLSIILYTDEQEKYNSAKPYLNSLHSADNTSKIYPKAGASSIDFQNAIGNPSVLNVPKNPIYTVVPKITEEKVVPQTPQNDIEKEVKSKVKDTNFDSSTSSSSSSESSSISSELTVEFRTLSSSIDTTPEIKSGTESPTKKNKLSPTISETPSPTLSDSLIPQTPVITSTPSVLNKSISSEQLTYRIGQFGIRSNTPSPAPTPTPPSSLSPSPSSSNTNES
jgi:hypothetical protein